MNILKFLQTKKSIIRSDNKDSNQLVFSIHKNGDVDLEIYILNTDETDSTNLSKFLFELNNGAYISSIISTLSKIGKNDSDYISFIQNTLIKWYGKITHNIPANSIADNPMVSPSEFGNNK